MTVPRREWLSEAMLLALLPAWAYLAASAFERGYCSVFGVPEQLISIQLDTVLLVGGAAVVLVAWALFAAGMIRSLLVEYRENKTWLTRALTILMAAGAVWTLGKSFALSSGWRLASLIGLLALLLVFWWHGPPTLRKFKPSPWVLYGGALVTLLVMWWFGTAVARSQGTFLVYERDEELVLLRAYGQRGVCIRIERTSRSIQAYAILPLDGEQVVGFRVEKLGPLRLAQSSLNDP